MRADDWRSKRYLHATLEPGSVSFLETLKTYAARVGDLRVCVGVISHGNYRPWNIWQHASGLLPWEIPSEQYQDAFWTLTLDRREKQTKN